MLAKKDARFEEIGDLLINYSLGNFDAKINISSETDEIDAFITSIHMLGEELKCTTISKNYYNNIFNSVSDMLFVFNKQGIVESTNNSVGIKLNIPSDSLIGKPIDNILFKENFSIFSAIKESLHADSGPY